jgi:hypothetical protein
MEHTSALTVVAAIIVTAAIYSLWTLKGAQMTHPKRPRDPNQLAKSIIDIATGQKPSPVDNKDPAAVAMGKRGGKGRAE